MPLVMLDFLFLSATSFFTMEHHESKLRRVLVPRTAEAHSSPPKSAPVNPHVSTSWVMIQ